MQSARRYHPDAVIQRLPPILANQIAAGEVVERPASIVKELIENALDAGASQIDVQIRQGGLQQIRVSDNGFGIRGEELELAVSPHATSKVSSLEDLENIASLGFRGEALASISSVARLEIESRFGEAPEAWRLVCSDRAGANELLPSSHPPGTSVTVSELFYNTPARRRFLRSERTEYRYIEDMIKRMALSRFEVGFTLKHNQRDIFRLFRSGQSSQQQRRVERLCGKAFLSQALQVDYAIEGLRLWGWLGTAGAARSQADLQYVYVNGRSIRDKLVSHALRQAYQQRIYPGRYPAYVLFLELDSHKLDVNVHPTKHEVRFHEARLVHDFLVHVVSEALATEPVDAATPSLQTPATKNSFYTAAEGNIPERWQVDEADSRRTAEPASHAHDAETDTQFSRDNLARQIMATGEGRYLVFEEGDELLIVDGRVVREEQLRRRMAEQLQQAALPARPVLIPLTLHLSESVVAGVEQQQTILSRFGFELSPVSASSVLLRKVPIVAGQADLQAMLPLLFDSWIQSMDAADEQVLLTMLAEAIARHEAWRDSDRQQLVQDALRWQKDEASARFCLRWDAEMLARLFAR